MGVMKEARVMPVLTALPRLTLLAAGALLGGLLALSPAPVAAAESFDEATVMQVRDRHYGHHRHHRHWHGRGWDRGWHRGPGGHWMTPPPRYYRPPPPVYYLPPRPRYYYPYAPRYYAPPPGVSLHFRF
jgi:hypothetical protein